MESGIDSGLIMGILVGITGLIIAYFTAKHFKKKANKSDTPHGSGGGDVKKGKDL